MNKNVFGGNIMYLCAFNNYSIAGNICNTFAIGKIGAVDDFYLVGMESEYECAFPLLSGNILNSSGQTLLTLKNNVITFNPGDCFKVIGDYTGYEIRDKKENLIFRVQTFFAEIEETLDETFITTLTGDFYNKDGEVVYKANAGENEKRVRAKAAFGFNYQNGSFSAIFGYKRQELDDLEFVLRNKNADFNEGLF